MDAPRKAAEDTNRLAKGHIAQDEERIEKTAQADRIPGRRIENLAGLLTNVPQPFPQTLPSHIGPNR